MTKEDLIELVKFAAGEIIAPTELSTEDAESILDEFLAVDKLTIPVVVGQSEQLKAFADWLQSDTANLNYDFKDLVDEYLKSL